MRIENKVFHVTVEGESESIYLDKLQELVNNCSGATYKLHFNKKKCMPTSFVKSIATGYSEFDFYHIGDYEGNSNEDITKFYHLIDNIASAKTIKKVQYSLAYTNLCFELWIILHFGDFNQEITSKDKYRQKINNLLNMTINSLSELKKADTLKVILSNISIENVKSAISRAKTIKNFHDQTHTLMEYKKVKYYKENPDLNLHEFIELVLKECGLYE